MANFERWSYRDISQFYERVRMLLDNVSEISLPDKYIDVQEKAPYAEMYVRSKVKNWKELDEIEFATFESAIVFKTASLFESMVSASSVKKKELPTLAIEYFQKSGIQIGGLSLGQLADAMIAEISSGYGIGFTGFVVTD